MELFAMGQWMAIGPIILTYLITTHCDMLPLLLILYGEDDDEDGGSLYGNGDDSLEYGVDVFGDDDGDLGSYVDSLLDGNEYDDDVSVSVGQDLYDAVSGSYGGFLNLSRPYRGSYEPKYGL